MKRKFSPSRFIKLTQGLLWGWFILSVVASPLSFKKMSDNGWTRWSCPKRIQPNYTKTESYECSKYLNKYPEGFFRQSVKSLHWECYKSYDDYVSYGESLRFEQNCIKSQNHLIRNIIVGILPLIIFYTLYFVVKYLFPK